jgi:phenylacetate-CoA ligase
MKSYNNLLEKVILPIGDRLYGGQFIENLKGLRKICQLDKQSLESLVKQKKVDLLRHAVQNVPYYKSLRKHIDSQQQDISIADFPILEKDLIQSRCEELLFKDAEKLIKQSSSGSTGQQTSVFWSKKEQSIHRATQILWWEWAGYRMGDPILQTGITPNRGQLKMMKDKLFRTYYLSAFSHTREQVIAALLWAKNQQAPVLAGYASSLYVIAQIAKESGIEVKFKTAISWGDKLFPHYRAEIRNCFNCQVFETYASAEGLMIGAQMDLDYMYLMTPNILLEIVGDDDQAVPDGQMGQVLVTNLNARSMPLIRYRIGDLAIKLSDEARPVNAKLPFPCLKKVIGRDTDIVRTPSGKFLVVHSFTGIFEFIPEIKQFCVIQNSLQGILIQYIPNASFSTGILIGIRERIQQELAEEFQIDFQKVDHITPSPSGKPQIIISNLK